jgi:hypothetical protein
MIVIDSMMFGMACDVLPGATGARAGLTRFVWRASPFPGAYAGSRRPGPLLMTYAPPGLGNVCEAHHRFQGFHPWLMTIAPPGLGNNLPRD